MRSSCVPSAMSFSAAARCVGLVAGAGEHLLARRRLLLAGLLVALAGPQRGVVDLGAVAGRSCATASNRTRASASLPASRRAAAWWYWSSGTQRGPRRLAFSDSSCSLRHSASVVGGLGRLVLAALERGEVEQGHRRDGGLLQRVGGEPAQLVHRAVDVLLEGQHLGPLEGRLREGGVLGVLLLDLLVGRPRVGRAPSAGRRAATRIFASRCRQ